MELPTDILQHTISYLPFGKSLNSRNVSGGSVSTIALVSQGWAVAFYTHEVLWERVCESISASYSDAKGFFLAEGLITSQLRSDTEAYGERAIRLRAACRDWVALMPIVTELFGPSADRVASFRQFRKVLRSTASLRVSISQMGLEVGSNGLREIPIDFRFELQLDLLASVFRRCSAAAQVNQEQGQRLHWGSLTIQEARSNVLQIKNELCERIKVLKASTPPNEQLIQQSQEKFDAADLMQNSLQDVFSIMCVEHVRRQKIIGLVPEAFKVAVCVAFGPRAMNDVVDALPEEVFQTEGSSDQKIEPHVKRLLTKIDTNPQDSPCEIPLYSPHPDDHRFGFGPSILGLQSIMRNMASSEIHVKPTASNKDSNSTMVVPLVYSLRVLIAMHPDSLDSDLFSELQAFQDVLDLVQFISFATPEDRLLATSFVLSGCSVDNAGLQLASMVALEYRRFSVGACPRIFMLDYGESGRELHEFIFSSPESSVFSKVSPELVNAKLGSLPLYFTAEVSERALQVLTTVSSNLYLTQEAQQLVTESPFLHDTNAGFDRTAFSFWLENREANDHIVYELAKSSGDFISEPNICRELCGRVVNQILRNDEEIRQLRCALSKIVAEM